MKKVNKAYIKNKKEIVANKISKSIYFTLILKIGVAIALFFIAAFTISGAGVIVENGALNVSNNLIVNTSTLFVDSTNNRVGIGTISPAEKLVVIGNANISGTLNVTGRISFPNLVSCDTIDTNANGVLSCGSDATGGGGGGGGNGTNPFNSTGNKVYLNDSAGLLGIGKSPIYKLDVAGTINASGLLLTNDSFSINQIGNVGIGIGNATQKLHLNGGTFLQTTNGSAAVLGGVDTGASVNTVFVAGRYAYLGMVVGGGNEFEIVDISNVTSATSITATNVSGIDMGTTVENLFVAGRYAYLALTSTGGNDFEIVDISNVSAPKNVSGIDFGDHVHSVYVSGRYAYLGVGSSTNNFQVVDISNPNNPVVVATAGAGGNQIWTIKVVGRYAYVGMSVSSIANEFAIIDVSVPTAPVTLGGIDIGATTTGIDVSGRYAYVGHYIGAGNDFQIIDVLDPTKPKNVSGLLFGDYVQSVVVSGKYAYLGMFAAPHLRIVDISNPLSPVMVSGTNIVNIQPNSLVVYGKYAYTGSLANSGNEFRIINLQGIDAPTANIGTIDTNYLTVQDNARVENNLYVGTGLLVGVGGILTQGGISLLQLIASTATINVTTPVQTLQVLGTLNITAQNTRSGDLFVASSGNVGIGTTVPKRTLHVSGNANITGNLAYGSLTQNSPNLIWTEKGFVTCAKAMDGKWYVEYVDANLNTVREWVDAANTAWQHRECYEKIQITTYYFSLSESSRPKPENLYFDWTDMQVHEKQPINQTADQTV